MSTLRSTFSQENIPLILAIFFVGLALLCIWWSNYRILQINLPSLSEIKSSFSWQKLLYSLILIGLVATLLSEIGRIWLDNRTFIGSFRYYGENGEEEARGSEVARRILDRHSELRRKFADEEQSDFKNEQRLIPLTSGPISSSESVLQDLSITVQKVNITDILTRLRRWVSAPREIIGSVSSSDGTFRAVIDLVDSETKLKNGRIIGKSLHFEGFTTIDDAAFEIACAVIWVDAAVNDEGIASVDRSEFCNWTRHWSTYLDLSRRLHRHGLLSEKEVKKIRATREALTLAIEAGATYPKHWSLRADFVDLLPPDDRASLRVEKQNDELRYLTLLRLDLEGRTLPDGEFDEATAYQVLAEARPALLVKDGVVVGVKSKLWERVLDFEVSQEAVRRATLATGLLRIALPGEPTRSGDLNRIGFAVGRNLIATAESNIVFDSLKSYAGPEVIDVPDDFVAEFVFANTWPADEDELVKRHKIKRILHIGGEEQGIKRLAFLEIEDHNTDDFPPLEVDFDAASTLDVRRFVCLIGFPQYDTGMPSAFMQALLGSKGGGHKRVMPGLVVAVPKPGTVEKFSLLDGGAIVVDASTSGGTTGAPLIDLHNGRLIGMNIVGKWQNISQGRFAYSIPAHWMIFSTELQSYFQTSSKAVSMEGILALLPGLAHRDSGTVLAQHTALSGTESDLIDEAREKVLAGLQGSQGYNSAFLSKDIPLPSVGNTNASQASTPLNYIRHTIIMNKSRRLAYYSAENVDGASLMYLPRVRDKWKLDPRLETIYQVDNELYRFNDLDRGHLTSRLNILWGEESDAKNAAESVFFYTNATPQHKTLNQGGWLELERALLDYIQINGLKASIFSGPVFQESDPEFRGVNIPESYWKIVVIETNDGLRTAGYIMNQDISLDKDSLSGSSDQFDAINSQKTIAEIEARTQIDFGPIRHLPTLTFD